MSLSWGVKQNPTTSRLFRTATVEVGTTLWFRMRPEAVVAPKAEHRVRALAVGHGDPVVSLQATDHLFDRRVSGHLERKVHLVHVLRVQLDR